MGRDVEPLLAGFPREPRWVCEVCKRDFVSHANLARHDAVHISDGTLAAHLARRPPLTPDNGVA